MLLGINGAIGSGKSTATEYLGKKYNFTEYMFAKPLKDIAVILGFDHKQAFGTQEDKLGINPFWGISCRQFLQVFGSEVCRDYLPKVLPEMNFKQSTLWVRLFEKFYDDNKDKLIAVSDVRFKDECESIKKLSGWIIRIDRTAPDGVNAHGQHLTHQSELQANNIVPHFIIKNDGSIEELYAKLDSVIRLINDFIYVGITSDDLSDVTVF